MFETLRRRWIIALIGGLWLLNFLDGIITLYAMSLNNPHIVELNPFFTPGTFNIKMVLPMALTFVWSITWYKAWREEDDITRQLLIWMMIILNVAFTAIFINNIVVLALAAT